MPRFPPETPLIRGNHAHAGHQETVSALAAIEFLRLIGRSIGVARVKLAEHGFIAGENARPNRVLAFFLGNALLPLTITSLLGGRFGRVRLEGVVGVVFLGLLCLRYVEVLGLIVPGLPFLLRRHALV